LGPDWTITSSSPIWHSLFSSCAMSRLAVRITLPYSGCRDVYSTRTTAVLSILLLTTLPVSLRLVFGILLSLQLLLAENRLHPRNVPLGDANPVRVLKLAYFPLETQVEEFFLQLVQAGFQLARRQLPQICCFELHAPVTSAPEMGSIRFTILLLTGSL